MIEEQISSFLADAIAIRQDLHRHPELQFEEYRTSQIVIRELERLGFKVTIGLAKTGVVGTLTNGTGRTSIGLRADMDALPITERTNLPYASCSPGKMHACGHDGHTATLLAAARVLSERRNFDGTVHLIFQPAEEDISGAKQMVEEGLFERFPMDAIYAMHNIPGMPVGQVATRAGAITTEVSIVGVTVKGIGGHGALPHLTADPIVAASAIVMALQTIVSRNLDPIDMAVVTVGSIHGGVLGTIIPDEVKLKLGVRTVTQNASELMARRVPEIIRRQAQSLGCEAEIVYPEGYVYPAGYNDAGLVQSVRGVALSLGQLPEQIDRAGPFMFSEDFSFMQQIVKGCYFGIGNGDSRNLHDPGYDFNDALLLPAAAFWVRLVEQELRVQR
jgi:hippurate hydrolase